MDRRVWLDLGESIGNGRVRCTLTVVDIDTEKGFKTYAIFHGSVESESLDTLDCPGVRSLRDEFGEWNIAQLHPLAKKYLLRTWEPL